MIKKSNPTDGNQNNTQTNKNVIGFGKAIYEIFKIFITTIVIIELSIKFTNWLIRNGHLSHNNVVEYIPLILALIILVVFFSVFHKILKITESVFGDIFWIISAVSLIVIGYAIYEYSNMRDSIKAEMVFEKLEKGYDCRFNPQQLNLQNNLTITLNDKKNEIEINNEGLDCKLKEKE